MIAADTSSVIAFLMGDASEDTAFLTDAITSASLCLPPVVVTELLSDPVISVKSELFILELPVLDILDGFWVRAAKTRATILQQGFKAKTADALVAQSCLDHNVALITRDKDFRHYVKHCGLKLYAS